MVLLTKNFITPVHQKVALSNKRKFCWEGPAIGHRKHDPLGDHPFRDRGPLAVGALGNAEAGGEVLWVGIWPSRGEHRVVPITHDLGIWYIYGDVLQQASINPVRRAARNYGPPVWRR